MNSQSASPDQLEREIVETRTEIDHKLALLQQRLAPRHVAGKVMDSVGGQGGVFARNLGATLRDNPVPVILLAIGICWLMVASRQSGQGTVQEAHRRDRPLPEVEPAAAPRTAAAMGAAEVSAVEAVPVAEERRRSDRPVGVAAGHR